MGKNICFISDHGDPLVPLGTSQAGGQNNYVKQLALALDARGHSVDVYTHWSDAESPQFETFGNRCRVIRIAAGKKKFVDKTEMLQLLPAFFKEMKELHNFSDYDILHTHYWLSGLLGAKLSKEIQIPWVHTSHSLAVAKQRATGLKQPQRLKAERMILSRADAVIATTLDEKALIKATVKHPSPIRVLPIGVSTVFTPEPYAILPPLTFTFAGRLEKTKGIYTLLRAFKLLSISGLLKAPIRLQIIGGEPDQVDFETQHAVSKELQEAVKGIEHQVDFLGCLPPDRLATYFRNSLAVIVPSYYESFGMVAAEAQACGSPVIASNVGGLGDIVINNETGLQVKPNNTSELASAMGLFIKRPDIASQLGKKAARFAQQNFNWKVIAKKVDKLYEGISQTLPEPFVSN